MSLTLPNLDDKTFAQITAEGLTIIPSVAPEWTDHNIHDPGITFLELFAWLAEIDQYRLNRTSAASYERFFSLIGLTRRGQQPAEVTVETDFDRLAEGAFVPANTTLKPIGNDSVPFQSMRDLYLTSAELVKIAVHAAGRVTEQTNAEANLAGHYEPFGLAPQLGDYLELQFRNWFSEPEAHLAITLYENDLSSPAPFEDGVAGFVSSARVCWEYLTSSGWAPLDVIEDGTLNFSRSGILRFHRPLSAVFSTGNRTQDEGRLYSLRARLVEGSFEIPPRIFSIVLNTIQARQVETIVDEDLGSGLGTPDQELQLTKSPLLLDPRPSGEPFQVGEVLDWRDLVSRLTQQQQPSISLQQRAQIYVAARLQPAGLTVPTDALIGDDEKRLLAQAFNRLLEDESFYDSEELKVIRQAGEFFQLQSEVKPFCSSLDSLRRFNRFLLQRIFPDLILSDRIEIQTDGPADGPGNCGSRGAGIWRTWERVDSFHQSGPDDLHYVVDPKAGVVYFGNGLNGRVPTPEQKIRARFYRVTRGEQGNLPSGNRWQLDVQVEVPPGSPNKLWRNITPATGGSETESLSSAKARSRALFRQQAPVLTAEDYEAAVMRTPGLRIARTKVVANFNPHLPAFQMPGEMTVIVVPQAAPRNVFPNATPPVPSVGFLRTVTNHLEKLRMVTSNIYVVRPDYQSIDLACLVFLKKRVAEEEAKAEIHRVLNHYLDPINGGPEGRGGWPFGRSIFPSEIYQRLTKIEQVDYVTGVSLNGQETGREYRLPYNGLPRPGSYKDVKLISFEQRRHITRSSQGEMDCE